jgi:hypothetical protein
MTLTPLGMIRYVDISISVGARGFMLSFWHRSQRRQLALSF